MQQGRYVSKPGLPYTVYSLHPAFEPHMVWNPEHDGSVDDAVRVLDRLLVELEGALTLDAINLRQAVDLVREPVVGIVKLLTAANEESGSGLRFFAPTLARELQQYYSKALTLPLHPAMTSADLASVIDALAAELRA